MQLTTSEGCSPGLGARLERAAACVVRGRVPALSGQEARC